MNHITEFQNLGIILKRQHGNVKTKCPKCSHTRKNKRDLCLSVNIDDGLYNCHNCGWNGNVKFKKKKEFIIPEKINLNITDRVRKWFKKRAISESTISHYKIGESFEYIPQVQAKRKCINFNYYRDEEIINIKFRDSQKNFKLVSGAELIFYGLNNIKNIDRCYIVEGEIDCMSLHEIGLSNVCSVPNGASKGNQRLEYLDNCWEYFKNKKQIILCTDNDDAGMQLRNELARRFGNYKCKYVDFGEFKDANEVLISKGKDYLKELVQNGKHFPLEGVINIDNIWQNVLNFNEKGIKNYDIGLPGSSEFFKLSMGEWSVVSGIPNSGKSDILDQVLCNLSMTYGFRCAMFSPESFPYEGHIKRIANKLKQKNCDNDDLNDVKDFIEEHFYWIKIDLENLTLKSILQAFRELVFQKGINVCVIDPYNMLDHSAQRDFTYVGKLLSQITQFCQQTKTHLFLVAHPRKIESEGGQYKKPTLYDISGSADFFNKAYNGIIAYRCIGHKTTYGSDSVKIFIEKVKRKENGQLGCFEIAPDFKNGGVYKDITNSKKLEIIKDNDIPF
jgi:twinkle protein